MDWRSTTAPTGTPTARPPAPDRPGHRQVRLPAGQGPARRRAQAVPGDRPDAPWLAVFGNHDGLIQGNLPVNPLFQALATGSIKITHRRTTRQAPRVGDMMRQGRRRRRRLSRAARVGGVPRRSPRTRTAGCSPAPRSSASTSDSAWPRLHPANLEKGTAYYAFDPGQWSAASSSTPSTRRLLPRARSTRRSWPGWRRELDSGERPLPRARTARSWRKHAVSRLFVLFSHHTIGTMEQRRSAAAASWATRSRRCCCASPTSSSG